VSQVLAFAPCAGQELHLWKRTLYWAVQPFSAVARGVAPKKPKTKESSDYTQRSFAGIR